EHSRRGQGGGRFLFWLTNGGIERTGRCEFGDRRERRPQGRSVGRGSGASEHSRRGQGGGRFLFWLTNGGIERTGRT
ncbi:MAG: hypothetical protein J6L82_00190, partial [Alphaproteobacteria bacterium]|nr:hypothetical protein [Alphaproteobacteria bacterium]